MSEVKRYNPELEKDIGLGLPCLSMLGNPYGEWVHYQDYAELKAQRDALAAENEALKSAIADYAKVKQDFDDFDGDRRGMAESLCEAEGALVSSIKTPATAAYLNSVRADAVTSFAHHQRLIADSETDPTIQRGHRLTAGLAEDFAAQLRVGEPS